MSDVKIGSLFMALGFDVDQVKLNDVVQSIGKLNVNSVLAGFGVAGLVDGLKQVMEIGTGLTEPLYQFGQETGLNKQKMQQWTEYAIKMGASGDLISNSLTGLQKKMAALKFGDTSLLSGIYLLQQAGAKINQTDLNNPVNFFEKAVEGLKKIDPSLKTYVAGLLGLQDQVILLKNLKDSDVLPASTEEQIEALHKYSSEWNQVGIEVKQVVTDLASQFAPSLEYLGNVGNKVFSELHKNSSQLRLGVEEWVGIIALATGPLGQIGFIIAEIALHLKDIKSLSVGAFTGAKGLLNNYLTSAQNNLLAPIGLAPHIGAASGSGGVNQQNTITIIAHNIEDLEHKVAAFFEKTIAKSFYQNSQNY